MSCIDEIKPYLRDINLEILMNNLEVNIDISKRYYNRFRLFYPNRKIIKYVTKIGGVLTEREVKYDNFGNKYREFNLWVGML